MGVSGAQNTQCNAAHRGGNREPGNVSDAGSELSRGDSSRCVVSPGEEMWLEKPLNEIIVTPAFTHKQP